MAVLVQEPYYPRDASIDLLSGAETEHSSFETYYVCDSRCCFSTYRQHFAALDALQNTVSYDLVEIPDLLAVALVKLYEAGKHKSVRWNFQQYGPYQGSQMKEQPQCFVRLGYTPQVYSWLGLADLDDCYHENMVRIYLNHTIGHDICCVHCQLVVYCRIPGFLRGLTYLQIAGVGVGEELSFALRSVSCMLNIWGYHLPNIRKW